MLPAQLRSLPASSSFGFWLTALSDEPLEPVEPPLLLDELPLEPAEPPLDAPLGEAPLEPVLLAPLLLLAELSLDEPLPDGLGELVLEPLDEPEVLLPD